MNAPPSVPEITPTELDARFQAGDTPLLVDVREPFEVQIADLPDHGQLRIPLGEFVERHGEIDRDREVVVYCRSGGRSAQAVAMLIGQGYEHVLNMKGGVLAWREEIDPSLQAY